MTNYLDKYVDQLKNQLPGNYLMQVVHLKRNIGSDPTIDPSCVDDCLAFLLKRLFL